MSLPRQAAMLCLTSPLVSPASADNGEVNVYTYRETKLIQPLFDAFTKDPGIKVNVVPASLVLEQRMKAEGTNSPADVLLTVDIGRIDEAVQAGVTQPIKSEVIEKIVPAQYRDPEGHWAGNSGMVAAGTGPGRLRRCRRHRLCDPLSGGADRADQGRLRADSARLRRQRARRRRRTGHDLRPIHLPLLRPAMLGAVILVFVDCLKELPATLLLRPMNVDTLATSIYQFASRGSFEEGALAALLIVAASIGPVVWLTRFSDMPSGPA